MMRAFGPSIVPSQQQKSNRKNIDRQDAGGTFYECPFSTFAFPFISLSKKKTRRQGILIIATKKPNQLNNDADVPPACIE